MEEQNKKQSTKKEKEKIKQIDRTLFWVFAIIALSLFLLGYVSGRNKEETVKFTYEEIRMIEKFQSQLKDNIGKDADVIVYKTNKGQMMLGWDD